MDVLQKHRNTCGIAVCIAVIQNERGLARSEEDLLAHDQSLNRSLAADRKNAATGPEQLAAILGVEGINAKVYWPSQSAPCIATKDIPVRFANYENRVIVTLQLAHTQYHAVLLREVAGAVVRYMDPAHGKTIEEPIHEFEKKRHCMGNPNPSELREILVVEGTSS